MPGFTGSFVPCIISSSDVASEGLVRDTRDTGLSRAALQSSRRGVGFGW